MSSPASEPAADASLKLRLVLDYVPCEVCLATPTKDQHILCSICARLDRDVGVRATRRTAVIIERPEAPPEPVFIPPAPTEEPVDEAPAEAFAPEPAAAATPTPPVPQGPPPVEVHLWDGKRRSEREGRAIEVIIEPYAEHLAAPVAVPAPVAAAAAVPEPEPAAEEASFDDSFGVEGAAERPPRNAEAAETAAPDEPVAEETEDEDEWDDLASFEAPDDGFAYEPPAREERPEPARAPEEPQDDFVFRPPQTQEEPEPARVEDDDAAWAPAEEVPVEPEDESRSPWARPEETDFLAEEAAEAEARQQQEPEPEQPEAAPLESDDDDIIETEIVEMEVIEDEPEPEPQRAPEPQAAAPPAEEDDDIIETEIVEMEIIEDEPEAPPAAAPAAATAAAHPDSDLYRLRGFDDTHFTALESERIVSLSHLSGHDANDLARRTGLAADHLVPWVQVADLVHEVGVPIDAAVAMVAAGVPGPRGLAEMDEQAIVDRVQAFGGASVSTRDVKRWKRRV